MNKKPYEVGISPDGRYYYAHAFRVPYSLKIGMAVVGEFLKLGDKESVLGCLLDIRGTKSISSAVDKYNFAYEKANLIGLPHIWRIALLKDPADDSPDFIETVMQNAGFSFKIFESEPEAIGWIKEKQ